MRKPLLLLALAASVCAVAQQRLLGGDISMLPSYARLSTVIRKARLSNRLKCSANLVGMPCA